MSKLPAFSRRDADKHVIIVRRPLLSDGIGCALRSAFAEPASGAPVDWALLVERIDSTG